MSSHLGKFYQALAILVVASLCAPSIVGVYRDHSLFSLDGAFQTYNMVSAIDRGLVVGADYFPYLGPFLGYVVYPVFKLLGGTLFASTAASYLLSNAGFAFALWILAGLVGITGYKRGVVVLGGGMLIIFSLYGSRFWVFENFVLMPQYFLDGLYKPGNSLSSLRWLLPYISAAALLWGNARFVSAGKSFGGQRAFATFWGSVTGLQLYWSPDAGLPSTAAMVFAWVLFDGRPPFYPFLGRLALMIAVAVATAFLMGLVITSGNLAGWFGYLFGGMREEQWWFFGSWEALDRVFSFSDLVRNVLSGMRSMLIFPAMAMASIVAIRLHRTPRERMQRTLLVYVTFTLSGTALLPQIGGHVSDFYATPIIPPFVFLFYLLARDSVGGLRRKGGARLASTATALVQKFPRSLLVLITWSPIVLIAAVSAGMALHFATKPGKQTIFVSALGASVSADIQPVLDVISRFARDADNVGLPADARIFSSYTSAVDLIAGAVPPSPYGMLIHALGSKARHDHLEALMKHDYPLVTTINPQYSAWGNWNLRASWYVYREIVKRYKPFAQTNQHIFWVPRDEPLPPAAPMFCSVGREASNRQVLSLEGSATWSNGEPLLSEIILEVDMELTPSAAPFIGSRALLTVVERRSALAENEGVTPPWGKSPPPARRYGVGQRGGRITLVVEHNPGATSIITLESLPSDRSVLTVRSCSARAVAPAVDIKMLRPLTRESLIPVEGSIK